MTTTPWPEAPATATNDLGYHGFRLGEFTFTRDEYFAYINWPTGHHVMSVDAFLARPAARRRLGFLLRHRQLRPRGRHLNHYGTR